MKILGFVNDLYWNDVVIIINYIDYEKSLGLEYFINGRLVKVVSTFNFCYITYEFQ